MLYNSSRSSQAGFSIGLILGAVLLVGALAAMFFSQKSETVTASVTPLRPNVPQAWRIEVEGTAESRFSGRYPSGGAFFVPQGALFHVHPESAGEGAFRDSSGSWLQSGGEVNAAANAYKAPSEPGLYNLSWNGRYCLDVLVLTRAETKVQGEKTLVKVDGKNIGSFHDPNRAPVRRVRENARQYQIPRFFAKFNRDTIALKLAPDFELGQLIAYMDYYGADGKKIFTTQRHTDVLPISLPLIDKLVKLRERLRTKGVKVSKFWITSGFRTPDYNRSIHGASYSRHCYGDAVDLCIDEDGDKHMDDLNGDGRIDRKDGLIIANAVRELEAEGSVVPGGIGVYEWESEDSVRCHVHIDCRGYISRWGQIGSGRTKRSFVWWPKEEFQEEENGE